MADGGELLTIKQVVELTGLSCDRIRTLCMTDRLSCTRESHRWNSRYLIRRRNAEALRERLEGSAGEGD